MYFNIPVFSLLFFKFRKNILWPHIVLRHSLLVLWKASLKHIVFSLVSWGYKAVSMLHLSSDVFPLPTKNVFNERQERSRGFTDVVLHENRQAVRWHRFCCCNPERERLDVCLSLIICQRIPIGERHYKFSDKDSK